MKIKEGEKLPLAEFFYLDSTGFRKIKSTELLQNQKVIIIGVPGAFTKVCSASHLPGYVKNYEAAKKKGVTKIVCISVNDPNVMKAWGDATGASAAGITMLSDAESAFTKAIGMDFDAPPAGLIARSKRYAMLVEDGVVTQLNEEASPGECEISAGEGLLDVM